MVNRYIIPIVIVFMIGISMIGVQTTMAAKTTAETNDTYQHQPGDENRCTDCHTDHIDEQQIVTIAQQPNIKTKPGTTKIRPGAGTEIGTETTTSSKTAIGNIGIASIQGAESTTNVIGNITLITSMGQNWYQQGIYGQSSSNEPGTPSDKSWGWTFFDENPPSGYVIPSENVIQRDNIYALLLDDGNNSNPITGANVTVNVTYWKYDGVSYTSYIKFVQLTENINHKGFYSGRFNFYGGTPVGSGCTYCHASSGIHGGGSDTLIGYFPGNYTASIKAEASGKVKNTNMTFDVTTWGCENCHGSGNRHEYVGWLDIDSVCYICHGVRNVGWHGPYEGANPHQNTAHINISCTDCHTNKSIDSQTFSGVTFINRKPQFNGSIIQLSKGTHSNLVCTDCHNNLTLPDIQGGYKSDKYNISDTINKYDPTFASVEQFQDYYVIDITSPTGPLNITLNWEGTTNMGFYTYPPDFNPDNRTGPYINGATFTNKPENYNNNAPMAGKWMIRIAGYDLLQTNYTGVIRPSINYTINSTYPIQKKDLPLTPECNTCHNSAGSGGVYTKYEIPDWNPGFAHVDVDKDGTLDIQCRMCHDSMHDIKTRACQNCHGSVPIGHIITEPAYSQYTTDRCLACHGDPHVVGMEAEQCIECHGTNYTGANPSASYTLVDITAFNRSIHQNINNTQMDNVSNYDCWSCHYEKSMNREDVRKCGYCHNKTQQWHGNANIGTNLTELSTR